MISDRYTDSTLVYQGIARGLPREELIRMNRFATEDLVPDLTLLLDGATDQLVRRVASRGNQDRLDLEGLDFHRRVREGFLTLAAEDPARFCVIDADRTIELVQADIESCVTDFLQKRGR